MQFMKAQNTVEAANAFRLADIGNRLLYCSDFHENSICCQNLHAVKKEKVEDNTVHAIAALYRRLNFPASSIRFHSNDPRARQKLCPKKM
jgi:hypothetical protein